MVETSKQVRVDNWGIYFLQRLQLFFSKTDFCDLTLQFEGNVQLKVHRLVMNACTEYFAFLEQTCPAMEENTIMMPSELQADVIVPIVNFMYTGMLEFHPSLYDKLYRAADTMNIAVLTKLLEAQLAPMSRVTNRGKKEKERDISSWKEVKKATPVVNDLPASLPGKKVPVWKKRNPAAVLQSHPVSATFTNNKWNADPIEKYHTSSDNTPKPTRFEWPEEELAPMSSIYPTFDDVSLTSKPLWTKEDDQKADPSEEQSEGRRNSLSQGEEDEFVDKERKVKVTQSDASISNENSSKRKSEDKTSPSPKRIKISQEEDETVISITTSNPSEVDHTKIVSEILKKYPDLVKKNKNIKLKITQAKNDTPEIKIQTRDKARSSQLSPGEKHQPAKELKKEVKESPPIKDGISSRKAQKKASFKSASDEGPWTCMECFGQERDGAEFVLYYLFRKHMADRHQVEFDSSLCKYCGKKCPKKNFMDYHLYTKHGLKPPRDVSFPKCYICPFIAVTQERLEEHMKIHGKDEVQCKSCHLGFINNKDFIAHQQIAGHNNRSLSILDCAYCMKKLQSPVTLFTHVRAQHLKEARRDGVTSLDEIMDIQSEEMEEDIIPEELVPEKTTVANESRVEDKQLKDRVKIISNVKVAHSENSASETAVVKVSESAIVQEHENETVAVTTTAASLSNIGGNLATNLGLVDIVVLDDNQQYILQQPQGQTGNPEFILPHDLAGSEGILQAATANGELNSTDELVMVLTDHDYQDEQSQGQSDNSNIVVLYSHPVEGQQGQFITSQGNLLVNSEGVLEIRNGAAITTTADQLLVNSDTITTTQAQVSPIESIDLIRKEIEGSIDMDRERGSMKTEIKDNDVLDKEINTINKEEIPTTVVSEPIQAENDVVSVFEQTKKEEGESLDTTDSTFQEEPMDVGEIEHQQKIDMEDTSGQELSQPVQPLVESEAPEIVNASSNEIFTAEEQAGHDVPPDNPQIDQENTLPAEVIQPEMNLVMNDPNHFEVKPQNTSLHQSEPMEVDGANVEDPSEILPGADEVDNQVTHNPETPSATESTVPENCTQESQVENKENLEQPSQEEGHHQEVNILSEETQEQSHSTEDQNEVTAKNENVMDVSENVKDVSENPVEDNHEAQQPVEQNINDANDNVQLNYDDFTDESQQSSGQKALAENLNKEILDDWDDTDSQEPEQEQQDDDQPALNASENVTKLMDDWDEEDEDQTK